MRKIGSKAKKGIATRCGKCGYRWNTKQKGYICCSHCKRYFKRGDKHVKK